MPGESTQMPGMVEQVAPEDHPEQRS
jgi:hypothetical protein